MNKTGSHKTVYILLWMGAIFVVGSLPLFFLNEPVAVFHQSYKAVRPTVEAITPGLGKVYGGAVLSLGILFIALFVRVRRSLREDGEK